MIGRTTGSSSAYSLLSRTNSSDEGPEESAASTLEKRFSRASSLSCGSEDMGGLIWSVNGKAQLPPAAPGRCAGLHLITDNCAPGQLDREALPVGPLQQQLADAHAVGAFQEGGADRFADRLQLE